jgi:predicted DNA binding CopG/RHH family protein
MRSSKNGYKKLASNVDLLDRDLSSLLEKGDWRRVKFEFKPKNKTITLRISEELLKALKDNAKKNGLDYQKFIRIALEKLIE